MYIEDALTGVIKIEADAGNIPGLTPDHVSTDATKSTEWEGENAVFCVRENDTPIHDLTGDSINPEFLDTLLTVSALGVDKAAAFFTIRTIETILNGIDRFSPTEIDDGDLFVIVRDSVFDINESDVFETDEFDGDGLILNHGVIRGKTGATKYSPFYGALKNISVKISEVYGVERFDNGAFKPEYYQVRKLNILHERLSQ